MGFQPVSRRSLSDAVFEQLSEQIFGGELAPGDALPPERELCTVLGVNRGAVREALKRRAQAGLVDIRHGGGSTVLDYRRTAGMSLLPLLLFRGEDRVDFKVARSVMEMRAALAPDLARLCAQRADEGLVEALRATVGELLEAEDTDTRQLRSLDLWDLIAEGSQNIAYRLAANTLRETYEPIRELLANALHDEMHADDDYRALVEAIAAHDEEAARTAGHRVVERGTDAVLALIYMLEAMAQAAEGGE